MLVLSLTVCPPALRGDLSLWLQEIDTGVYVGQVSQRVREELWERVTAHLKSGRAIMVFNAKNEQGMDFCVHQADWEPIDFDGLKLMLRPNPVWHTRQVNTEEPLKNGYSQAAKIRLARRMAQPRRKGPEVPERFIIMDLETTGLSVQKDEILEVGAIKVNQGKMEAEFHALIRPTPSQSNSPMNLSGLSFDVLNTQGVELAQAIPDFLTFLETLPLVSHNIAFDMDFINLACVRLNLKLPLNHRIDTLEMARRYVKNVPDYKLATLSTHFQLPNTDPHRSMNDCHATWGLLKKLIEIRDASL